MTIKIQSNVFRVNPSVEAVGLRLNPVKPDQLKVRLTPWALKPFIVGVLSAAAAIAITKLPHTAYHSNLSFVALQNRRPTPLRAPAYCTPSEPLLSATVRPRAGGGRRRSVRPHSVRRPRLCSQQRCGHASRAADVALRARISYAVQVKG